MARGRPTVYSSELADRICDQLAIGRSLIQIAQNKDFPCQRTIYYWLDKPEFLHKYVRARELQAEHYADEIIALADTPIITEKRTIEADGSVSVVIGDNVERTKVQIDARKWYASKLAPKKYGDKSSLEVTGELGIKTVILAVQPKQAAAELPAKTPDFIEGEIVG